MVLVGDAITLAPEFVFNPVAGLQVYVVAPDAVNGVEAPLQIVAAVTASKGKVPDELIITVSYVVCLIHELSFMVAMYVPGFKFDATAPVCTGLVFQVIAYGDVPPVTVTVAEPVGVPQDGFVIE